MENKCVYVFLDHRKQGDYQYDEYYFNFEPIYVGKGSLRRPKQHKYLYKYYNKYNNKYKCLFYSKIISIINETNVFPEYVICAKNLTEVNANELEKELIKKIGRIENGGTLTNMSDGGDGQSGFKFSDESKKKKSIDMKDRYVGRLLSDETKLKISVSKKGQTSGNKNPMWGKKQSEYCKAKIVEANKKQYKLTDISGKTIIIDNLSQFCLKNNIPAGCLWNLRTGHSKKYKNWIELICI